jgi:hypothetical protein
MLAVAVSASKVAFVYFEAKELCDWWNSDHAGTSVDAAFAHAAACIERYRPTVLVIQDFGANSRKGKNAQALAAAIEGAARDRGIKCLRIPRPKIRGSKYRQAADLAKIYPRLEPWLPSPRKPWESEKRNILLFEALSLAHSKLMGYHDDAST